MSTDQEKHDQGALQHDAEHERPRKRNPVLFYLVILFAAAFLLLLMSYFSQQRSNQAALDNLQQTSNSAAESLENLIAERDDLKRQVADLNEQVTTLQGENAQLTDDRRTQDDQAALLTRQAQAMEWFWQIDDYYARGYYSSARTLVEQFEALALKEALPAENTTGTDRYSPAQRYQEIYDALY